MTESLHNVRSNRLRNNTTLQKKNISENISKVTHILAVISGKGGTGKSTLSVYLSAYFSAQGMRTALVDVDIHGPNIMSMLGIQGHTFEVIESTQKILPITVAPHLQIASIAATGVSDDVAFVWRGPIKLSVIQQLFCEVEWGAQDIMIIDTPPGTGDEILTVAQQLPQMDGCVIVSTPQKASLLDVRKSIDFAGRCHMPILGIVENMADSSSLKMFGSGGTKKLAEEKNIAFLGDIPLDMAVTGYVEEGSIVPHYKDMTAFLAVAQEVEKALLHT